ncbi:MAG: NAD(P)H-dependent oxidoreductase [Candidatus Komeilibacteria bacterium]|nr:NAD(P)H-dependent oxidoreductase [Candidatus Komeilibacteria bacterium]
MTRFKVLVIYGSVRDDRQGIKAARFMVRQGKDYGWETELIDPLDYDLPLLRKMYKEYEEADLPPKLKLLQQKVAAADGYIIVSGEYNHSIPPALSNLLDHFLEEYARKPSAIVSYSNGGFGGVRAAMQLRVMLAELGMSSIPTILPIPLVQDAFTEDGAPADFDKEKKLKQFLDEFAWYLQALKNARNQGPPSKG